MSAEKSLDALRLEIDAIDDSIHDLIIRRTEVVEGIRDLKRHHKIKIRPDREAEILGRLTARHKGPFPKRELVRIWRELIVATLSFEGPFSIAVYMPEDASGYWDLARDQYGSYSPMSGHASVRRVIEAVRSQDATVGVLPLPSRDDPDPWWRHLANTRPDAPRIVARLPFAGGSNGRDSNLEALAICPLVQRPTGRDRSFLVVETKREIGLHRLASGLTECGLTPCLTMMWHDAQTTGSWLYLAEVDEFAAADDRRLSRLRQTLGESVTAMIPLGGYAVPLGERELSQPEAG